MKIFKEILIPICLWLFFISSGINAGRGIAMEAIQPPEPMPLGFQSAIYLMAFMGGFAITVLNMNRKKMGFEDLLGKIFTPESFLVMEKRISPFLLGATFFGLMGLVGIIQAQINHSPVLNQQILGFPFMASVGIVIGWFIGKNKREKSGK